VLWRRGELDNVGGHAVRDQEPLDLGVKVPKWVVNHLLSIGNPLSCLDRILHIGKGEEVAPF
jgi:hypothetical protein